jgi:hypothetical protein
MFYRLSLSSLSLSAPSLRTLLEYQFMSIINRNHERNKFFMAFLETDRLCSRLGSGDAVLKLFRNKDIVNTFFTSSVRMEML